MGLPTLIFEDDHIQGLRDSKITLVEYADFECPYCSEAAEFIKTLLTQFNNKLCYVFRHFPLTDLHDCSVLAAEAAEAAGIQGKFWNMHDSLFQHQDALFFDDIMQYAKILNLDLNRFKKDLQSGRLLGRIARDFKSGQMNNLNSTPTFFLNNSVCKDQKELSALIQMNLEKW